MNTETLGARNPLTGQVDHHFAVSSRDEVAAACAAVRAAQPAWAALGIEGRSQAVARLGREFAANGEALRAALAADTGRQRIAAIELGAVQGMVALGLATAPQVLTAESWRPASIPGIFGRRQLVAAPVVGVIAPWNFPVVLSMIDTLPALLAGCGVVLKPSEITPRHAQPLAALLASVPEIAAVTRVVLGPGRTGADLVDHADAIVLTGSVRTGRIVAEHAARRFIPAFLELGGKDAVIITAAADLDRAATAVLRGSVLATGQACQSLERVYVERSRLQPLLERLRARLPAVRLTCDDPRGHIGPFIMADQARIVREHIEDALARGACCEFGGRIVERGGLWCEPTLLSAVDHSMRVMREETFGPVMPVMPFDSLDEAIALANDGDYGLSANVFAGSEDEALAIARRLDAGFVSIDDVSLSSVVSDFEWEGFRFSGLGRSRMGPAGIARYLRSKAIVINRGPTAEITALTDL
ncbi:MAG: aldehyde dehydrogenase family protein [Gammaproteobacteria bacterium]|nr:aldehyde dehydrogenase family protein [Gammaproteobacteria bacterium]